MKNKEIIYASILLLVFITSCRKDKIYLKDEPRNRTQQYMPMAVGNYWVYDVINYDHSTNTGTFSTDYDTLKIIGTTIIRSNEYFMLEKDKYYSNWTRKDTLYWRDSIGYIVDNDGIIKFSATDFDTILDTWETANSHVNYATKDSTIIYVNHNDEVFECLDFRGCFWYEGALADRQLHNYFAKDIGPVYENYLFSNPTSNIEFRRELREYHLE